MIEELFSSKRLERVRRSWIRGPIERYVDWLVGRRYARASIIDRLSLLVHFGEFGKEPGTVRIDDLPRHVAAFVDHWVDRIPRPSPRTRITCAQKVGGSLRFDR